MSAIIEQIQAVVRPFCQAENFELVTLEMTGSGPDTLVRIYLDKPGGITLDDCVYVSRQLGDLIEVHVEAMGSYRLEVSSPGPNRPLNTKSDFIRFRGERVRVETSEPVEGQKKFTGILETVKDESIVLSFDGKMLEINDQFISRAMLKGQ